MVLGWALRSLQGDGKRLVDVELARRVSLRLLAPQAVENFERYVMADQMRDQPSYAGGVMTKMEPGVLIEGGKVRPPAPQMGTRETTTATMRLPWTMSRGWPLVLLLRSSDGVTLARAQSSHVSVPSPGWICTRAGCAKGRGQDAAQRSSERWSWVTGHDLAPLSDRTLRARR